MRVDVDESWTWTCPECGASWRFGSGITREEAYCHECGEPHPSAMEGDEGEE